jgi:hypothetical protein
MKIKESDRNPTGKFWGEGVACDGNPGGLVFSPEGIIK